MEFDLESMRGTKGLKAVHRTTCDMPTLLWHDYET